MNCFFLDASALSKRYTQEVGNTRIDRLFNSVSHDRLICLMLGAAEVVSVLVRRRNGGVLSAAAYAQGVLGLTNEVVNAADFQTLEATNLLVTDAFPFIDQHSLNATDAIVLRYALNLSVQLRAIGDDLVLVASDQRLLRAAQAEGLLTFDPEAQTEPELDTLLTN